MLTLWTKDTHFIDPVSQKLFSPSLHFCQSLHSESLALPISLSVWNLASFFVLSLSSPHLGIDVWSFGFYSFKTHRKGFRKRSQTACLKSNRRIKLQHLCFIPGRFSPLGWRRQMFNCSVICPQALLDNRWVNWSRQVQPCPATSRRPHRLIMSAGDLSQSKLNF